MTQAQRQPLRFARILIFCAILCCIDGFIVGLPVFGMSLATAGLFINLLLFIRLMKSPWGESSWYAFKAFIFGITILAILAIFSYNRNLGRVNAEKIVVAVQGYKAAVGSFPENLAVLVPEFMPKLPVSAYRLLHNGYVFVNRDTSVRLIWVDVPPYGRGIYDFLNNQWSSLD